MQAVSVVPGKAVFRTFFIRQVFLGRPNQNHAAKRKVRQQLNKNIDVITTFHRKDFGCRSRWPWKRVSNRRVLCTALPGIGQCSAPPVASRGKHKAFDFGRRRQCPRCCFLVLSPYVSQWENIRHLIFAAEVGCFVIVSLWFRKEFQKTESALHLSALSWLGQCCKSASSTRFFWKNLEVSFISSLNTLAH